MKKSYKPILLVAVLMFFSQVALAQFTITGTITDESTGEVLVGANLFHQASSTGATTDSNGEFSIDLPGQSATLRVTYIGYVSKNVDVNSNTNNIEIQLSPDVSNLEEVVVTGLASSVKRQNLANSVASVSAEELNATTPKQTISAGLYGKVPGANISSNTGAPGGGISVKLRGVTTINGSSEPLYIVDGVYLNNDAIANGSNAVTQAAAGGSSSNQDNPVNRVADLNPEDIESIEILKGASAAAIYGQRASGGVVIITTKRGRGGTPEFSVSQSLGFTTISNKLGQRQFTRDRVLSTYGDATESPAITIFDEAAANDRFLDYEELLYGQEGLLSRTQVSSSFGNATTQCRRYWHHRFASG